MHNFFYNYSEANKADQDQNVPTLETVKSRFTSLAILVTFKNLIIKLFGVNNRHQDKRGQIKNYFFLFISLTTKTYVLGAQKNCLNETVLLSTLNICLE